MKEILKQALDVVLLHVQLNELNRQKTEAIKVQDFKLAYELRGQELEIMKQFPSLDEIKELHSKLQ